MTTVVVFLTGFLVAVANVGSVRASVPGGIGPWEATRPLPKASAQLFRGCCQLDELGQPSLGGEQALLRIVHLVALEDPPGESPSEPAGNLAEVAPAVPPQAQMPRVRQAPTAEDRAAWRKARQVDTVRAYAEYVERFPAGAFVTQARRRMEALRVDDRPYQEAVDQPGCEALERFLENYPGHAREEDARQELARRRGGTDLVALVAAGSVTVEAQGAGMNMLTITVSNLTSQQLEIWITPGTWFAPVNPQTQVMVVLERKRIVVRAGQSVTVSVLAGCASPKRTVPCASDKFVVRPSRNPELEKVASLIDAYSSSVATRQAALWIVVEDADWEDLGALQTIRPADSGLGITVVRAITEVDAAEAMKLCQEAGVDIRQKAIWRDREKILSGLPEGDLRTWLHAMVMPPQENDRLIK